MKTHPFLVLFLPLVVTLMTFPAAATLVSSVDLNAGFSTWKLKAVDKTSSLSSLSTVEVNYALKHSTLSTAYTMSFMEMLEAQGKQLPVTRFSLGMRWYPLGFNGSRLIIDQNVSAKVWKATPFGGIGLGLASVSTEDTNASLIDLTLRGGLEMPISSDWMIQGQLILGSGSSMAGGVRGASYESLGASLGIVLSAF